MSASQHWHGTRRLPTHLSQLGNLLLQPRFAFHRCHCNVDAGHLHRLCVGVGEGKWEGELAVPRNHGFRQRPTKGQDAAHSCECAFAFVPFFCF